MKQKMLSTISYFLFLFSISSCDSSSKFLARSNFDISKVPQDFNPKKHILLVAEMPRLNNPKQTNPTVTAKLDKALKENYPYKYQIVPLKDIFDNKKYSDTSIYKYALLNNLTIVTHTTTTTYQSGDNTWSTSPSARTAYIDFNFFDRATQTKYPVTGIKSAHLDWEVKGITELINRAKKY